MIMKKHTGYTLIELMVTMAVMATILSVGLPQLSIYFQSNSMISNTNEIVAGLHLSRSEAIKRQTRVSMCQSSDQVSCTGTANWEEGFLVFADDGGILPGNCTFDVGEVVLRVNAGADGSKVTIRSNDVMNQIEKCVTFTSRGVPKAINGASQSGTFRICDSRGLKINADLVTTVARGVVLALSGRVRSTNDKDMITSCP